MVRCGLLPVDPWAPTMDSQSVASQLFAVSLFPYLGFLYFMSKTAPRLTLFGFYFLLAFVGATSTRYFSHPHLSLYSSFACQHLAECSVA
jgi:predicted neutral ceramidase superfamily lipid hydrolase